MLCRQRCRKEWRKLSNSIYSDAVSMQRGIFVQGVAVTGGLASLDVKYNDVKIEKDPGKGPQVIDKIIPALFLIWRLSSY